MGPSGADPRSRPARSRLGALVVLAALGAIASWAMPASSPAAGVRACSPSELSAQMEVIPGSAGAGNIEYRLVLENVARVSCLVQGRPGLALQTARGEPLPTHVTAAPPVRRARSVTLAPRHSAAATLRFSPDVPGPGEQRPGACERTAARVRVTLPSPGRGSLRARIIPATAVCEHGTISESDLVALQASPRGPISSVTTAS